MSWYTALHASRFLTIILLPSDRRKMGFAEASAGDEGEHQVYAKEVADKKVIEVLFMKVSSPCESIISIVGHRKVQIRSNIDTFLSRLLVRVSLRDVEGISNAWRRFSYYTSPASHLRMEQRKGFRRDRLLLTSSGSAALTRMSLSALIATLIMFHTFAVEYG